MRSPKIIVRDVLKKNCVNKVPVNIEEVVASHGIRLHICPLPEGIKGTLHMLEDPIIMISEELSETERRFMTAHEFGHALMHFYKGFVHVDKNTYLYKGTDQMHAQEIEANRFAAELLMPKFLVKSEIGKAGIEVLDMEMEGGIPRLALEFSVNPVNMCLRLQSLGYLNL